MTAAEERELARARKEHKELLAWRGLWGVKDATPELGKMILVELSDAASLADAREQDLAAGGAVSRARRFSETGDVSILTEGLNKSDPEATIVALAARLVYVETKLHETTNLAVRLAEGVKEAEKRWPPVGAA